MSEENLVEGDLSDTGSTAGDVSASDADVGSSTPDSGNESSGDSASDGAQNDAEVIEASSADNEAAEETPEFQPNFKIKVADQVNGGDKEYEIPEKYRQLMTDASSEKEMREIFEKVHGIDFVKNKLGETRKQYEQAEAQNVEVLGSISNLRNIYQSAVKEGNYLKLDRFFQGLEIPQEVLFNYVREKLQLAEMPPEQRQVVEARLRSETRAESLSQVNDQMQSQTQRQAIQIKEIMLNQSLQRQDVVSAATNYDSFVGKPGAFRDAVIREGQLAHATQKVDLTPEQAIDRVIANYGLNRAQGANANAQPGQQNGAGTKPVVVRGSQQTIPNVGGRSSASPMKSKPKSLDDLKKIRQDLIAAEGN